MPFQSDQKAEVNKLIIQTIANLVMFVDALCGVMVNKLNWQAIFNEFDSH